MKWQWNKKYAHIALYSFLTICAAILFWQALSHFDVVRRQLGNIGRIMLPFAYGFGLAFILAPVLRWIENRLLDRLLSDKLGAKAIRSIGILLTYVLAFGVVTVLLWIVLPEVTNSLTTLVNKVLVAAYSYEDWLTAAMSYLPEIDFQGEIVAFLDKYASTIAKQTYDLLTSRVLPRLSNFTVNVASGALKIIVGIIISIYFLMDKERFRAGIKRMCYAVLPKNSADWWLELVQDCNEIFSGFIVGKIIDSAIIGLLCFVGMRILNMPNVMLVSVIVGVTNVIPYFGPFIGAIPSFFIILIDDPIKALIFGVFIFALQQFDGNILGPKILGESTGLSAFWVIFAITLFGGLFGFMGMFLGVPVFSVITVLYKQFTKFLLRRKNMPLGLRAYAPSQSPFFSREDDILYPRKRQRKQAIHYVDPLGEPSKPEPPSTDSKTH